MTGQELWASLLQEAIQGRLVEQRDDEPAVEQIGDAPEDVPFAIPEKWKWVTLGDVIISIQAGKSYKCNEVPPEEGQCGLVKVSAVSWGEFKENESKTCFSNDNWVEKFAIHENDFLISRANTAELVGNCVIVRRIHKKLMLSDKILRIKFSDIAYQLYILYLFRSKFIRQQLSDCATGTSNSMKNISQEAIKKLTIALPPLAEQRRIVARLEELRPLVDDYGTAEAELSRLEADLPDRLRASLLQEAIQGRLVEQRDDESAVPQIGDAPEDVPFAVPEKWKWIQIKHLVTPAKQKVPDKNFNYIDVGSIDSKQHIIKQTKHIDFKQAPSRARKIVKSGMLLYSTVRPYLLNTCVVETIKNETIASTAFITVSCGEFLVNYYLLFILISTYFCDYVTSVQKGVAYPAITDKDFYSAFIPLPPLAEQRRIVARLEELLPEVATLRGEQRKA